MGQAKMPNITSSSFKPSSGGAGAGGSFRDKFAAAGGNKATRDHLNHQADLHARAGNAEGAGHIAAKLNAMDKAGK
ncbi:MAG: hypothetical protein Q8K61_08775 [Gallionella sp.]|nr:hypothetical protein [Gallionella sp.]